MLELNQWFFVLLLNFLILLYVLNTILFRPLLKLFKDRDDFVKDSFSAAKELERKKDDAVTAMTRELQDARHKSKDIFDAMRGEGMNKQREIIEGANRHAMELIGKARSEIASEGDRARQQLRSEVDRLSDEIVKKLIGA